MKLSTSLSRFFLATLLMGVTTEILAQSSSSSLKDIYDEYSVSAPPKKSISFLFTSSVVQTGCTYEWKATNSLSPPPGTTAPTNSATYPVEFLNVNGTGTVTCTLSNCNEAFSNGKTATYSAPIRYLGNIGNIALNSSTTNPQSQYWTWGASIAKARS